MNPPTSTAGPLQPYTLGSSLNVPFVAGDDRDLGLVELWVRSRPTPTAAWGTWTRNIMGQSSPFFIGISDGYYQFATVAVDRAGNREALPAVGDAEIRVGPETVNDDLGTAFQGASQATTGRDGSVALAWVDNRISPTISDVYFARRQDATSPWASNERVDAAAVAASSPSVAIDAVGNTYVAWVNSRRCDKDIYAAKRPAATGVWGPAVRINDDPIGAMQDSPSIAVSTTGEVIAVWADSRGNKARASTLSLGSALGRRN